VRYKDKVPHYALALPSWGDQHIKGSNRSEPDSHIYFKILSAIFELLNRDIQDR